MSCLTLNNPKTRLCEKRKSVRIKEISFCWKKGKPLMSFCMRCGQADSFLFHDYHLCCLSSSWRPVLTPNSFSQQQFLAKNQKEIDPPLFIFQVMIYLLCTALPLLPWFACWGLLRHCGGGPELFTSFLQVPLSFSFSFILQGECVPACLFV